MPNSGYFDVVFAQSGDLAAVPDAVQPDGSVSFEQGYGIDYELDPATDPTAKDIERTKMNQIFNYITAAIQQYQQVGTPPFITSAMNGGTPYSYPQYARVLSGGVAYQSLVNANTDTPPSANWIVDNPQASNIFVSGTTTGSAGAQVLASLSPATGFSLSTNGYLIVFTAGFAPTGATTLQVTSPSVAATDIKKAGPSGLVPLTGGEWAAGETVMVAVNTTGACFELLNPFPASVPAGLASAANLNVNIASSTTLNMIASEIIVETTLNGISYKGISLNKTLNIATTGAGGMDTGGAPAGGQLDVYLIYNPASNTFNLLGSAATGGSQLYSGGNMPAGYTASALISSCMMDGSAHFIPYQQFNNQAFYQTPQQILSGGTATSYTLISAAAVAPVNAKTAFGTARTSATASEISIAVSNAGFAANAIGSSGTATGIAGYWEVPIISGPSVIYYKVAAGSGNLFVLGYTL